MPLGPYADGSLEMQADPEDYQGPQQNCEDRGRELPQPAEMSEVVMRYGDEHADDDVDDEDKPHPAAHQRALPPPTEDRSAKQPHSAMPSEVEDRQHDQHDHEYADDSYPTDTASTLPPCSGG